MDQQGWSEDISVPGNQCFVALAAVPPGGGDYLTSFLTVLLEFCIPVSGVKSLGMTFVVVSGNGGS